MTQKCINILHRCIIWYRTKQSTLKWSCLTIHLCLSVSGIQGHQSTSTSSFPGYSKGPYSQNQPGQRGRCWGRSALCYTFAVVFNYVHFIWWMTEIKKACKVWNCTTKHPRQLRESFSNQSKPKQISLLIRITQEITFEGTTCSILLTHCNLA